MYIDMELTEIKGDHASKPLYRLGLYALLFAALDRTNRYSLHGHRIKDRKSPIDAPVFHASLQMGSWAMNRVGLLACSNG